MTLPTVPMATAAAADSSRPMNAPRHPPRVPGQMPVVIDGELDVTTEIPLVRPLPPVPAAARPVDDASEDVNLWWYGGLFGLCFAVALMLGYPLGQLLLAWSRQ